jgi:16S rRNA C1402 (ribose-2'-O) methylase RsmI
VIVSNTYYIHGVHNDIPRYHHLLGGNSLRYDLNLSHATEYHRDSMILYQLSKENLISILQNMLSIADGIKVNIIDDLTKIEEDCKWFIWHEY